MEQLLTGFKFGIIIILLVPGFIFIQIIERHLLREKKPQFEKSLEIILFSAIIWSILGILPWYFPFYEERGRIYKFLFESLAIKSENLAPFFEKHPSILIDFIKYYFSVCFWSVLFANLWGLYRRNWKVDQLITYITGRNWYPNVSFQFYKENLGKAVEFSINERRYFGILSKAPDTIDDNNLLIENLHEIKMIKKNQWVIEKFETIDSMLIKLTEVSEIKAYSEGILDEQPKQKFLKLLWQLIWKGETHDK